MALVFRRTLMLAFSIIIVAPSAQASSNPPVIGREKFPVHRAIYGMNSQELVNFASALGDTYGTMITPENIKSMSLGARIWGSASDFDNTPIFDLSAKYLNDLVDLNPGTGKAGYTITVDANTNKTNSELLLKADFGASARVIGYSGSLGYAHDESTARSSLNGSANVHAVQYKTNQIDLRVQDGNQYKDLSAYLLGDVWTTTTFDAYAPGCATPILDTFTGPKAYTGSLINSPAEHYAAIVAMEVCYVALLTQYDALTDEAQKAKGYDKLLMFSNVIKDTINAFYGKYGDSFVTEIRGYQSVVGNVSLKSSALAGQDEYANSASISWGSSAFLAASDVKTSVKQLSQSGWANAGFDLTAEAETTPANAVTSLPPKAFADGLRDYVQSIMKDLNSTTSIPSTSLSARDPVIPPVNTNPRTNPTVPPEKALEKLDDFNKFVKGQMDEWEDPADLEEIANQAPSDPSLATDTSKTAQEKSLDKAANIAGAGIAPVNASNGKESSSSAPDGGLLPESDSISVMESEIIGKSIAATASSSGVPSALAFAVSNNPSDLDRLHEHRIEKRLNQERRKLIALGKTWKRKIGKRVTAQLERDAIKSQELPKAFRTSNMVRLATASGNRIQFQDEAVSGFDYVPYVLVLRGLAFNPSLALPKAFTGFPYVSRLLQDLNRYITLDTYLAFINSYEASGIKNTSIYHDFHLFVQDFQDLVTSTAQASFHSGQDLDRKGYYAILNTWLTGKQGFTTDLKRTKLFSAMKDSASTFYVHTLAENASAVRILGKGSSGYVPISILNGNTHRRLVWCGIGWNGILSLMDILLGTHFYPYLYADGTQAGSTGMANPICAADPFDSKPINFNSNGETIIGSHPQSAVYPLFHFESGSLKKPRLVFLQTVQNTELVLGKCQTAAPGTSGASLSLNEVLPVNNLQKSPEFWQTFWANEGGFDYSNIYTESAITGNYPDLIDGYSLFFNNNPQASLEKAASNEALLVSGSGSCGYPQSPAPRTDGYTLYSNRQVNPLWQQGLTFGYQCPYRQITPNYYCTWGENDQQVEDYSNLPQGYMRTMDALKDKKVNLLPTSQRSFVRFALLPVNSIDLSELSQKALYSYGAGNSIESMFLFDSVGKQSPFDSALPYILSNHH
jgi:hypothetical protein